MVSAVFLVRPVAQVLQVPRTNDVYDTHPTTLSNCLAVVSLVPPLFNPSLIRILDFICKDLNFEFVLSWQYVIADPK